MKKNHLSPLFSFLLVCGVLFLGACTTSPKSEGKPLPELTYSHIQPLYVTSSTVEVENRYDPQKDPQDVSSLFPTPPDIILRRYASNRIKPQQSAAAGNGTLKFIIEDASIRQSYIKPKDRIAQWLRQGVDRYDILIRLRLHRASDNGMQGPHAILTFEHFLELPENLSMVERERQQIEFLEGLVQNVDAAVTKSLRKTLDVAVETMREDSVPVFINKPDLVNDPVPLTQKQD